MAMCVRERIRRKVRRKRQVWGKREVIRKEKDREERE